MDNDVITAEETLVWEVMNSDRCLPKIWNLGDLVKKVWEYNKSLIPNDIIDLTIADIHQAIENLLVLKIITHPYGDAHRLHLVDSQFKFVFK